MIWLVIFHWLKWLWWEVQYYFYARVRESLRSLMPCQPSLAKHSWAWYTWQMPENALGVAGFFQRLLPPLTSRRAEKSALLRAWEKEVGAQGIWIWMSQLLSSSAPTGWKVLRIQGDETQVFNKCRWMWYSFNISCMRAKSLWSCLTLWESSWTRARQAPLSMGISRQEYWRGLRALLRGIWPTQGSNPHLPCLLHWQANSLPLSHLGSPIFTAYPCGLSVISSAFWFLTCVRSISETAH